MLTVEWMKRVCFPDPAPNWLHIMRMQVERTEFVMNMPSRLEPDPPTPSDWRRGGKTRLAATHASAYHRQLAEWAKDWREKRIMDCTADYFEEMAEAMK